MKLANKIITLKKYRIFVMSNTFQKVPGFCPDCGSILPPLRGKGGVTCYTCTRVFDGDLNEGKFFKIKKYLVDYFLF